MDEGWFKRSRLRHVGSPVQLASFYMASIKGRGRARFIFPHDIGKRFPHWRFTDGRVSTLDCVLSSVPGFVVLPSLCTLPMLNIVQYMEDTLS